MVALNMFQRGILYFTVKGTNFLPLLKHGMDVYFYKQAAFIAGIGLPCERTVFPLVCYDDFGTDWSIYTELGCANVLALLTFILLGIHTALFIFFLFANCGQKKGSADFLAGVEYGFCGAGAVFMSLGAYDVEVEVHRKVANPKWRKFVRLGTAVFQFVLLVFISSSIRVVTGYGYVTIIDVQRTSLFVLLPCFFLNLYTMFEHVFEGINWI